MTFQPGQSGNPGGFSNRRPILDALNLAIREEKGAKALRRAIDKVLERAAEGDLACLTFVAERLEGKPRAIIAGDAESPFAWQVSVTQAESARDRVAQYLRSTSPIDALNAAAPNTKTRRP